MVRTPGGQAGLHPGGQGREARELTGGALATRPPPPTELLELVWPGVPREHLCPERHDPNSGGSLEMAGQRVGTRFRG